jgi:chromosomal replication initiation ATPase DnaA
MEQLALDLGTVTAPPATVIAGCNAAAYRAMGEWPRWPHPVLMVRGPEGSGKSHLARAFAERTLGTLVAGSALGGADVLALAAAPVAVDDIEGADERSLFHLVNAMRASGQALLLTGGTRAGVRLPDLASRLRAAPEVALEAPDDTLLRRVIVDRFHARQLPAEPAVVAFLLARIERTLHAAERAVEAIDKAGLASRRGPTRPLAAAVLDAVG